MILADFGADVIRLDRSTPGAIVEDVLCRGKRSAAVSLKHEQGRKVVLKLVSKADVVIDPYRPGVLERLGLGPEECAKASGGRVVYARLTGFERTGPYSAMAGHGASVQSLLGGYRPINSTDINYIALSGVLSVRCHCPSRQELTSRR